MFGSAKDPGTTGFYDCDRTTSGSTYHERMVRGRMRSWYVLTAAVVAAIVVVLACVFLALRR